MRAESFFASNASSARRERASRGGHARDETRWIIISFDECQPSARPAGEDASARRKGVLAVCVSTNAGCVTDEGDIATRDDDAGWSRCRR